MSDASTTTLSDLLGLLKARNVRVPAEIGAFVVLEVGEVLSRGPARVLAGDVRIADDGAVSIGTAPGSATANEAARAVIDLLGSVLVASGTGAPAALVRVVEGGVPAGPSCLERLRDDLEAALVPLNRQASRRVLARLVREARRDGPRAAPEPTGAVEQLDRELGALVGPGPGAGGGAKVDPVDALLADTADAQATLFEGAPSSLLAGPEDPATIATSSPGTLEAPPTTFDAPGGTPPAASPSARRAEGPTRPKARRERDAEDGEPEGPSPAGGVLGYVAAFVIVALLSAAVLAWLRPELLGRLTGTPPEDGLPALELPVEAARGGTLTVTSAPAGAQVLLYVGRAPVDVEGLSPDAPHELVALLEGRSLGRAVIRPGVAWEPEAGGAARTEVTLAVPEAPAPSLDLGRALLADADEAPASGRGTARVTTDPAGAKVYRFVGLTPEVRVEGLSTEAVVELLVGAEGHRTERVLIAPSDWETGADGAPAARISVTLQPVH